MCMMDLWITRHTIVRSLGAPAGTVTFGVDPNRLRLIVANSASTVFRDRRGNAVAIHKGPLYVAASATTDTNAVPPTPDTGTITATSLSNQEEVWVIDSAVYGPAVTDSGSLQSLSANITCYEVVADTVLGQKLADLDKLEGWPLFGSPR